MRIGIITHWKDMDNYGAALQSYALQRYLRDKGHEAFVIRYYPAERNPKRNSIPRRIINLIKNPFVLLKIRKNKQVQARLNAWNALRDFNTFRKDRVALSEHEYRGLTELQDSYPKADLYITGSDQVWHGSLLYEHNRAFFLDFGSEKTIKASYAASFGRNYFPCEDEALFKHLLSKFSAISMREESGVKILKEKGIDSVRCLDSTFLLAKEQYMELIASRKHPTDYAFFYTVNVTTPAELYWDELKKLLTERGFRCIVTTGSGYKPAEEIFKGAEYDYATVEEWLSNIYYSKIVITASFHGIALSIILQKDFIYMPLQGKYKKGNDRITDLLYSVGLSNRIADNWEDVVHLLDESIDFSNLHNAKFMALLEQSKSFLKDLTSSTNLK